MMSIDPYWNMPLLIRPNRNSLHKEKNPSSIKKIDGNGWSAIHEAVRADELEVLKWLVAQGLDINLRTHFGSGGTPLYWAKRYHGDDSNIVKYLESLGAIDIEPSKK